MLLSDTPPITPVFCCVCNLGLTQASHAKSQSAILFMWAISSDESSPRVRSKRRWSVTWAGKGGPNKI